MCLGILYGQGRRGRLVRLLREAKFPKFSKILTFESRLQWTEWSECSVPCGSTGKMYRFRWCSQPDKLGTGNCNGTTTEVDVCPPPPNCPTLWSDWGDCLPVENTNEGVRVRSNNVTTEMVPCKCPDTSLAPVPKPSEQNVFGKVDFAVVPDKTALNDVLTDGAAASDLVKELTDLLGE